MKISFRHSTWWFSSEIVEEVEVEVPGRGEGEGHVGVDGADGPQQEQQEGLHAKGR